MREKISQRLSAVYSASGLISGGTGRQLLPVGVCPDEPGVRRIR